MSLSEDIAGKAKLREVKATQSSIKSSENEIVSNSYVSAWSIFTQVLYLSEILSVFI